MRKIQLVRGQVIGAIAAMLALGACGTEASEEVADAAPPTIVIDGERLFPESITSDAAGNIYIGSNPGAIYRTTPGSDTAAVWIAPDEANGLQSVFGVLADDAHGLLWVCTNPNTLVQPPQTGAPAIKTFSLADGSLKATYPFPADIGPAMCNDMTIAANGDVYASEMLGGRIMRLPVGGDVFEVWAVDPEFASIDGISFAEDGTLYANSIQRNTFLRIGIEENGLFDNVEVLETSRPLQGPDGLRPLGDNRMLQSEGNGGTITLLTIPDTGPVEVVTIAEGIDYASSVTEVDGRAYFPEGKLSYMFDPAKRDEDPGTFTVQSVLIPVVK